MSKQRQNSVLPVEANWSVKIKLLLMMSLTFLIDNEGFYSQQIANAPCEKKN